MAVVSTIYLFDVEGFRREINPIIAKLQKEKFDVLQFLATSIAKENPQIWSMLTDFRLYPDDLGNEDMEFPDVHTRVNFWMLIILASHWQELGISARDITDVVSGLKKYGWTERDVKKLLIGNSQRALLQPMIVTDFAERPSRYEDWPVWCRFGRLPAQTGWLDVMDIQDLLDKLSTLAENFKALENYELVSGYDTLIEVLSTAKRANLGLFISATD